jgi:hypothetical protein
MEEGVIKVDTISSRFVMAGLGGTVFLGALLLFGMEPLVGRLLLPSFGGAIHVWLICLMFFQAMLLVGYAYAHLLAKKLGRWHLLLLALPLINLPLDVTAEPTPEAPVFTLLSVLLIKVGLPFAVLSTTAVVVQSWLARSPMGQKQNPYPLYAASNAGSLIALIGYPFLVEPLLGLRAQSLAWTAGYIVYAGLIVGAWFTIRPDGGPAIHSSNKRSDILPETAPTASQYALWLLLSCFPSAFLLTVTNFIAIEVGSFPMVWVFPLALYLLSFVVTFRAKGGIPRPLRTLWPEAALLGFLLYLLPSLNWLALAGHLLVLFITCLVAHGELYERRPPTRYLTNFYLTMALGGWAGGCAVSLVAPSVFTGLYDYPITLMALAGLFLICRRASFLGFWRKATLKVAGGRMIITGVILALIVIGIAASFNATEQFRHRNFYGTYRIIDYSPTQEAPGGLRKLVHGSTLHGAQLLAPHQQHTPTSYYYSGGGIAEAYAAVPSPRRIAVLGLGAGVVATYARSKDTLTFYEIDPDNENIARTWFTYLDDTEAKVRVVVGDGRLALKEMAQEDTDYDIIHLDAFTGDGIPIHLLTREAMESYLNRLAEDGLILFHISNRYHDLRSVVKSTSAQLALHAAMNVPVDKAQVADYENPNQCVVLARDPARLKPLLQRGWIALGEGDGLKHVAPWTDDYVNILSPLLAKIRNR